MCYRPFCAMIMCIIAGDSKEHVLLIDAIETRLQYCNNKLTGKDKRLIYT